MKPMTDEDIERYAKELKELVDEEGEPPEEDIHDGAIIDPTSDNLVIFLKKGE